jgi:hypothetical protein
VYAARVAPGSQTTLSAYQYWNGTAYTSNRLYDPNFNGWSPAAVLTNTPQGSISYNTYYNCYLYLLPGAALSGRKSPPPSLSISLFKSRFRKLTNERNPCNNSTSPKRSLDLPRHSIHRKHYLLCSSGTTTFRYQWKDSDFRYRHF